MNSREQSPVEVVVTGANGRVARKVIWDLAERGLGKRPVKLRLLEVPVENVLKALDGRVAEHLQSSPRNLADVDTFSDPNAAFDGADWGLFIGSKPRQKNSDGSLRPRVELLKDNADIFVVQGRALGRTARGFRGAVVGNPVVPNALVLAANAPDHDPSDFTTMHYLDHNRARARMVTEIQQQTGFPRHVIEAGLTRAVVVGNHSGSQVPLAHFAKIFGKDVLGMYGMDEKWYQQFVEGVRKDGDLIIELQGRPSATSAAAALRAHLEALTTGTETDDWGSIGVPLGQSEYHTRALEADPKHLVYYSLPVFATPDGVYSVVEELEYPPEILEMMKLSYQEIVRERNQVETMGYLNPAIPLDQLPLRTS